MEVVAQSDVRLRDMTREDLAAARELSREQNWPHRTSDWTNMLERGSGLVAESGGQVVGTAMCWRFGDAAANVGMVIVSPAWQGRGIGGRLMTAILEPLGDRAVFLNATDEGLALYTRLGFRAIGAIRQHQGSVTSVPLAELGRNERVRPMGLSDRNTIAQLDRRASGKDRREVIASLMQRSKAVVLTRDHEVVGFALVRRFGRGYAIGPTVAPDAAGAKALILHWLASKAGKFCRLDVFEDGGLSPWIEEIGLPCVGRVTTMVRGAAAEPAADARIFSLISQALG